jgi:hypothetical protein
LVLSETFFLDFSVFLGFEAFFLGFSFVFSSSSFFFDSLLDSSIFLPSSLIELISEAAIITVGTITSNIKPVGFLAKLTKYPIKGIEVNTEPNTCSSDTGSGSRSSFASPFVM